MRKLLILSLLLISFLINYNIGFSQNLVPNPSFEEENICKKYHENCSPKAWRSTTLKQFLYPEYLANQRGDKPVIPPDGTRFIGLRLFNTKRKFDRSIVQVPLLCKMEKGKKYKVQFDYLSGMFWVNSFEILFIDSLKIYKNNEPLLESNPQITIDFREPHELKKWLTFETIYEAEGNEVGFIIGNLKSDEKTIATLFNKKNKDKTRTYYYFDNFSITATDSVEICDVDKNLNFIYSDSIRHLSNSPILDVTMQEVENFNIDTIEIFQPPIVDPEPVLTPVTNISVDEIFTMKNILFESNSDKLLPIAYPSLDELISFLEKNKKYSIQITGHTDNVGNDNYNLILSKKRANSVANHLINNGIHSSRITFNGRGESQPIYGNDSDYGKQKNRRVEFFLIDK